MRKLLLFILLFSTAAVHVRAQSIQELRSLYAQEKYEAVVQLLIAPSSAEHHLIWADAHHKLGNFEQAMEGYFKSESLGATSDKLFLNRGICAFSLGDFNQMRSDLLRAKEMGEDKRIPYYFGAMAYLQNDYKSAAVYLKDALKLDPNYMEAHYLLGAVFLEQKKFKSAEMEFIQCIEIRPEFTQSKVNLALCYIDQFKFNQAIDLLTSLIETLDQASLVDAYYQRGVCHYQMHDTTSACEDWKMAAELGDADAKDHIAGICEGNQRRLKRRKDIYMQF